MLTLSAIKADVVSRDEREGETCDDGVAGLGKHARLLPRSRRSGP